MGFSQYRRLWIKNKIVRDIELNLLDKIILTDLDESWNEYYAIIPPAFLFIKKKERDNKKYFSISYKKRY